MPTSDPPDVYHIKMTLLDWPTDDSFHLIPPYLVMLQEVTQKILEAVGTVAGSSLEQTSWLSRNLEVKAQPQILPDDFNIEDVNGNVILYDLLLLSLLLKSLKSITCLIMCRLHETRVIQTKSKTKKMHYPPITMSA